MIGKELISTSFKKNIIANFFGQGWIALMSLAFIPLYINYLGIVSYGLIGIFAMLQVWLGLLDMGMTPALSREMARFIGGGGDSQSISNILRSIITIAVIISMIIALSVWLCSNWLATNWIKSAKLSELKVANAFTIMGLIIGLKFIEGIYRSAVVGLQKQVFLNIASSSLETLRGFGAVVLLIFISPTIEAFFIWQGIISILSLIMMAYITYSSIPKPPISSKFSWEALDGIKSFALGIMSITILSILLTQVDKLLLTHLLSLEDFGNYSLAFVVSNAIYKFAGPVTQAIYPHMTSLEARGDTNELIKVYHKGSQFVTILMGPLAIILIVFPDVILWLWTKNSVLTSKVSPLVTVISLGVFLNGIMQLPGLIQYVYNWTNLTIRTNIFALIIVVPSLMFIVPKYGSLGAAWVWVSLNTFYFIFTIHFLHLKILKNEKWNWYFQDIFLPLLASICFALIAKFLMPSDLKFWPKLITICFISLFTLLSAFFAAPLVRNQFFQFFKEKRIKNSFVNHNKLN